MDYKEEYKRIVKKIKAFQNGEVSESLIRMGISYPLVFGLTINQIKDIALPYKLNNELAWFLWQKEIRETKLLSLMIFDPANLTKDETVQLVKGFTNAELVEQAVIHVLTKQTEPLSNAVKFCQNESEFVKMTGYNLLARLSIIDNNISISDVIRFLQFIEDDSETNSPHIMRSISFALRKLGSINKEFKQLAINLCDRLENTGNQSALWVATDARIELEFTR